MPRYNELLAAVAANPHTPLPALEAIADVALRGPATSPAHSWAYLEALAGNPTYPDAAAVIVAASQFDRDSYGPAVRAAALARPGLGKADARALTGVGSARERHRQGFTDAARSLPLGVSPAVQGETWRAMIFASSSARLPSSSLLEAVTNPHVGPAAHLRAVRAFAASREVIGGGNVAHIAFAHAFGRLPARNKAGALAHLKKAPAHSYRNTDRIDWLATLPWDAAFPTAVHQALTHRWDAQTRADILAGTGNVEYARSVLDANPSRGEAQAILSHRHMPLPVLQAAALAARGTGAPHPTLASVLAASDPAWVAHYLSGELNPQEFDTYCALADLPAHILDHLYSRWALEAGRDQGRAKAQVALAWVATQRHTAPHVRRAAVEAISDDRARAVAELGKDVTPSTFAASGGRLAATGPELLSRSPGGLVPLWRSPATGCGGLLAARDAYLDTAVTAVDTAQKARTLLVLGPKFPGTVAELFAAVTAIG